MLKSQCISLVLMGLCSWTSMLAAAEHTKESLQIVKQNVEAGKAVLVDVREESELRAGHIEGAVLLPLSELNSGVDAKQLAQRLPKNKVLYTHCVVGKRSLTAGEILADLGFIVRPLKPGYKELLQAGFKQSTK